MSSPDAQGSPLAQLLDYMASQRQDAGLAQARQSVARAAAEPEHLDYFRELWADVNAHRQLQQSQAHVPDKAGPLNTHHIVYRSLMLARSLSPGYLKHLLGHLEALSWMEQVGKNSGPVKETLQAARPSAAKRQGAGKSAAKR